MKSELQVKLGFLTESLLYWRSIKKKSSDKKTIA